MMANIFKYATSELSQDAFLCWLFASIDGRDPSGKPTQTSEIARKVFLMLMDLEAKDQKVRIHNIYRQWAKIDVVVEAYVDEEPYSLVIEDKTTSDVHAGKKGQNSQLEIYYNSYNGYWEKEQKKKRKKRRDNYYLKVENIRYILYKTSFLNAADHDHKSHWEEYGIEEILKLFEKAGAKKGHIESEILSSYIERLSLLRGCFKDESDMRKWSVWNDGLYEIAYENFFKNGIFPELGDGYNSYGAYYRAIYYFVVLRLENDDETPKIEFQPRNFTNDEKGVTIPFIIKEPESKKAYTKTNVERWQRNLREAGYEITNDKRVIHDFEKEWKEKKTRSVCRFEVKFPPEECTAAKMRIALSMKIRKVFEALQKEEALS